MTYKLDDGTGTVEVKLWIDADTKDSMDMSDGDGYGAGGGGAGGTTKARVAENDWVRVWGRLRDFNNKRHVGAHILRPIVDKMDIQHHLLEATYVHLYFTRGPLDTSAAAGVKNENGGDGDRQMGELGNGGDGGGYGNTMPHGRRLAGVSSNARKVARAINDSEQSNEGLHVQHLAALTGMQVGEVERAGEELLAAGIIFTTVDESTWLLSGED